jgi:hypothetical protein
VSWIRRFLAFWYDFIVGDDWTVAATVVIAVAATWLLARLDIAAWWVLPVAVLASIGTSVLRAARSKR